MRDLMTWLDVAGLLAVAAGLGWVVGAWSPGAGLVTGGLVLLGGAQVSQRRAQLGAAVTAWRAGRVRRRQARARVKAARS